MAASIVSPFRGPVRVLLKAYPSTGTATGPTVTTSSNTVTWTDWTELNWQYQGPKGLLITTKTEVEDISVEGFSAPIQRNILGESVSVSVDILKTTWTQLGTYGICGAVVTSGTTGTSPNTIKVGGKNYLNEFSLGVEGVSDIGTKWTLFCPKCTINAEATFNLKKSQKDNYFPFVFDLLSEVGGTDGALLFTLSEVTRSTSIDPETVI